MKKIYKIKITLKGSKPPIWRRIEVDSETSMKDFSRVLLKAMGWVGGHLMQFESNNRELYLNRQLAKEEGEPYVGDKPLRLYLKAAGAKLLFLYDFGDNWEHNLVLEEILDPVPDTVYPVCTAGARACPPEDCGGISGYEMMLEILGNPKHPEYSDMTEWIEEDFDPKAFDKVVVTESMRNGGGMEWDME